MAGAAGKKALNSLYVSAVRSMIIGIAAGYAFKVAVADPQAARIKEYYGADYGKVPAVDIRK